MLRNGYVKFFRSVQDWEYYKDPVVSRLFYHLLITVNIKDSKYQGVNVPAGSRVCTYPMLAKELGGVTDKQVRTAIEKLERSDSITKTTFTKFSIVCINNWNEYQFEGRQMGSQRADRWAVKGQTDGQSKNNPETVDITELSHPRKFNKGSQTLVGWAVNSNESGQPNGHYNKNKEHKNEEHKNEEDDEIKINILSSSSYDESFYDDDNPNVLCCFKGNVFLSENQVASLLDKLDLDVFNEYIDRLDRYISKTGHTVKNHYETILKWYFEDCNIKS